MGKHIYLYLFLLLSMACNKEPRQYASKLERTLELSGNNRGELEKVLDHYSRNIEDSLKFKAAVFLIENMEKQYYRTIGPRKEWENLLELSDSLIKTEDEDHETVMDSAFQRFNKNYKVRYRFQKDIKNIKARHLIQNIDAAFNVWPKPWNDFLDFDGFCNYILPYRQKNEPLELTLREKKYQKSKHKFCDTSSVAGMVAIARDIGSFPRDFRYQRLIPFDQSISDIEKGRMTDCVDFSIYSAFRSRALGIPMVIDFALWPNSRSSHYWNSVVYSKDSILFADKDFFWGEPGSYRLRKKIAKIYRIMYAEQKPLENPGKKIKTGTFLDNSNIVDVTSQYIKTSDIKIKLRKIEGKTFPMAYLCIFNDRKWSPVAKAHTIEEHVKFKEVGRENIYTVFYIDKGKWISASQAFSVDGEGNISFHEADKMRTREVCLDRKAKLTSRIIHFGRKMAGGIFQLSNSIDFKISEDVYRIPDNDTVLLPRTFEIFPKKAYRYARYRSPIKGFAEIAELQWFSGKDTILGTIIGTTNTKPKEKAINAFDNSDLSYFSPKEANNGYTWIGLDFGKKKKLSRLRFAPRSDVNYIRPGDRYELFYWDSGWVSLGKKKAETYHICFDGVPKNALLWLRNLSKGIEEELFLYKDGKPYFWYSTDY